MSSRAPNPRSSRRIQRPRLPPLVLRSIDEEATPEYDIGGLDLGAESPRSTSSATNLLENNAYVRQWAEARAPYWNSLRRTPSSPKERQRSRIQRDDDRDCGICFDYAIRPCRTLCCGKIFCTEHLADWLHGPNAEGRCPHCENACSLVGGTLPLSPLSVLQSPVSPNTKRQTLKPSNYGAFHPSSLTPVKSHLNNPHAQTGKAATTSRAETPSQPTPQSTTSSTSTALSSELTDSSSDEEFIRQHYRRLRFAQPGSASTGALNLSTTPFSQSWGAISRLMSIITFLMFLYKLLS